MKASQCCGPVVDVEVSAVRRTVGPCKVVGGERKQGLHDERVRGSDAEESVKGI